MNRKHIDLLAMPQGMFSDNPSDAQLEWENREFQRLIKFLEVEKNGN